MQVSLQGHHKMAISNFYLFSIKYLYIKKEILVKKEDSLQAFAFLPTLTSLAQGPIFITVLSLNKLFSHNSLQKFHWVKELAISNIFPGFLPLLS